MKTKNRSRSDVETLLLVDDKPDNLIVMKKLLQRALPQVEIVTFQKPAEVMDYVRSANVSAAIFDVQMPVMNGIELCQKIKSTEETRHIPVLLVTSHEASSGLKTKGLDAGADDFLTRPIDNDELVARVKVALRINRAEVQLRRTVDQVQQNYQLLFERSLSGCALHELIVDTDGKPMDYRFLAVNPAFETLLNLRAEEVLGRTIGEVIPGLEPQWLERYARVVKTGEPVHFENYATVLDRHFDVTAFRTGENQFATSFTDITERKRVEQLQRESEERFRDIAECAADWIWETDANGVYTYSSAKVKSALGYRQDEVIGKTPSDFMPPAEAERVGALFVEIARDKLTFRDLENWNLAKDGRKVCLLTSGVPILNKDGELLGYRGVDRDITERKQMEEELTKSRNLLRDAQAVAHFGCWEYDISEDKNTWSDEMFRIFGLPVGSPLPGWEGILSSFPDDAKRLDAAVKGAIQGTAYDEEFQLIRPDGTIRWGRTLGSPVKDENGNVVRLIGTAQDITDRKQAEAEAERERLFSKSAISSVPGVFYVIGTDYRFRRWNTNLETVTGYSHDEMLSISPLDLFAENDKERIDASIRQAFESGTVQVEAEFVSKSGAPRPYLFTGTRVDFEGELLLVGIGIDITEKKQAEQKLLESEERFNIAADAAAIGIWEFDIPTEHLGWDDRMFQLYGIAADEFTGAYETWHNSLHPEDRQRVLDEVTAAASGGKEYNSEFRIIRPDGETRHIHAYSKVIRDEDGTPGRMIGTNQDITEEVKQEKNTRQAQKMESVGRLAGGVAHDFNNMLQVILGYTDLVLTDTAPTDPKFNNLKEIQKATERSGTLTKQLLAFAREQPIRPEILNLNDAVSDLLKMLRRLIRESIEISWHPGANLKLVKLDPVQIDQILVNLCVNAQDAVTGDGEIIIETGNVTIDESYYSGNEEALPGSYVVLTVSDNGSGMDKETLTNIFEPFYTTKETGKGTGLGLATVYGIVKQNKGFINVESEVGQGTSFKIHLPQTDPSPKEVFDKPAASLPHVHGETILLVEDQSELRTVCNLFLKNLGYNVLSAETSKEALHLFSQQPEDIQLLLTDVVMPGMNGMQLSEEIHAINPAVKVLFMSGYSADIISDQGVLDQNIAFIAKPFTMSALANKIREILRKP